MQQGGRRRARRAAIWCGAAGLLLGLSGCPRDTMQSIEMVERLTILEDAMILLQEDNAELAGRIQQLEARLTQQDTEIRRLSVTMDQVVAALDRR
jgi:hypothetical protein